MLSNSIAQSIHETFDLQQLDIVLCWLLKPKSGLIKKTTSGKLQRIPTGRAILDQYYNSSSVGGSSKVPMMMVDVSKPTTTTSS